jgi:predicted KAP-like P-loop ATPase
MWTDNETKVDYLNFTGVAGTVAELIVQANNRPISIGISGAWGVGKTSMIQLVQAELESRAPEGRKFLFITFSAWLYQGYDDARAALMDRIADELTSATKENKTVSAKIMEFVKRVKWMRVAKLAAIGAATVAGFPAGAIAATAIAAGHKVLAGESAGEEEKKLEDAAKKMSPLASGLLDAPETYSPPKEIDALRDSFREILSELDVTLVVLIDDLDRCLPATTISTLEAIKLFLFMDHAAFVIAADDEMIKHAVRQHFSGIDSEHVTNYFDKLIQIPIRVPSLSVQDVRAYLMLLHVENSTLGYLAKEKIRSATVAQLRESWKGKRITLDFMKTIGEQFPPNLLMRLESADRLAPIMTTAPGIKGNPRLIKRFLNTLAIRLTIAKEVGISIEETMLTKVLLLERCAPKAYEELAQQVSKSVTGEAEALVDYEIAAKEGTTDKLPSTWNDKFVLEWLATEPVLAGIDLRGILYISREHAPLLAADDSLSAEATSILVALLKTPKTADALKNKLVSLQSQEKTIILKRLMREANAETTWGTPPILTALLAVVDADANQESLLAAFLQELPPTSVKPSIVPALSSRKWVDPVFAKWSNTSVDTSVKKAITQLQAGK